MPAGALAHSEDLLAESVRPGTPPGRAAETHIAWLDGLRGFAALWVLLSHVQILVGLKPIPVLSWGGLAVDLFMLLSGFLMAHHYLQRAATEPWQQPSTALFFWVRRFFRIAPLYYLLLIAALALGPWLGEHRTSIANAWPWTATPLERYNDQSLDNLLMHLSFLFGSIPFYAFRTALPDWSIGLEMQFYLAFPLLMLLVAWLGPVRAGLLSILACMALRWLFPNLMHAFAMPSFLPLKLYVFFIGIWLAVGRQRNTLPTLLLVALLVAGFEARHLQGESIGRIIIVIVMFYLLDESTSLPMSQLLRTFFIRLRTALARPAGRFLGETSYAVYLLHLLVVLPVAGTLVLQPWYVEESPWVRFGICVLAVAAVVYPIAWLLYRTVEISGIRLGKRVIAALRQRPVTLGTDAS
jgi:peptidoglycan/LPS O-acetylase OafA/YrhL